MCVSRTGRGTGSNETYRTHMLRRLPAGATQGEPSVEVEFPLPKGTLNSTLRRIGLLVCHLRGFYPERGVPAWRGFLLLL